MSPFPDACCAAAGKRPQEWGYWGTVCAVVALHVGLLAYSATRQSPTFNEPGHLVAGLSHWELGRYELYRVNPPLTRCLATIPVMLVGYSEDWNGYRDSPATRSEFRVGNDFIRANGERSLWLLTLARWACIPISVAGGLLCFSWSCELWNSRAAGLLSLACWCFSPNIIAHGQLVTPDCAAATFGLGAGYFFWRWLKLATWRRALLAGLFLGLAELSKMSWIILFGLWPILWLACASPAIKQLRSILQLAFLLCLGVYVLNLGYGFDDSFTPLGEYTFVSTTLSGREMPGEPGNRFAGTCLGEIPTPVPKQYVLGLDSQRRDFEQYPSPSYLQGEWKQGGWWYYYLYGLGVKMPHGTQLLALLAVFAFVRLVALEKTHQGAGSTRRQCWRRRDFLALLAPPVALILLVSSQLEFNHHVRYVLPALGFLFVFLGAAVQQQTPSEVGGVASRGNTTGASLSASRILAMAFLGFTIGSTLWTYPHDLSYFNELAGGPRKGHLHLLHSNLDWGQDLLFLEDWINSRGDVSFVYLVYHGAIDPGDIGLSNVVRGCPHDTRVSADASDRLWVAVSANLLYASELPAPSGAGGDTQPARGMLRELAKATPVGSGGYSILVFRVPRAGE